MTSYIVAIIVTACIIGLAGLVVLYPIPMLITGMIVWALGGVLFMIFILRTLLCTYQLVNKPYFDKESK